MKYALLLLLWAAALAAPAQIHTRADSLLQRAQVISKTKDYPAGHRGLPAGGPGAQHPAVP